MNELLLKMEGIEKFFPGVHALKECKFDLNKGEVHALVGENGAGTFGCFKKSAAHRAFHKLRGQLD